MIRRLSAVAVFTMFLLSGSITLLCSSIAAAGVIQLPKTGQQTCYDSAGAEVACTGTGQDGESRAGVAWPNPRFVVVYCDFSGPCASQASDCDGKALNDMVTDRLTGLTWPRKGDQGSVAWPDAVAYANGFTLCGYSDWRLPNINELESLLIQAGTPDAAAYLNARGFKNMKAPAWSSTTSSSNTDGAFLVDSGVASSGWKSGQYVYLSNPLPVRGGQNGGADPSYPANVWKTGQTVSYATGDDGDLQMGVSWPSPRFTVGSGAAADCVTDNLTGLIWAKNGDLSGGATTWDAALENISSLNSGTGLCGYHDWRLPNIIEFASLADYSTDNPALPSGQPFTNIGLYHWSSTTWTHQPDSALVGNTPYGGVSFFAKSDDTYNMTWPVRGPNHKPTIGSLTPSSATSATGSGQTFTAVYKDADGYADLKLADFLITATGSGANSVWARYNAVTNELMLYNDAGTAVLKDRCTPGVTGTIQNSYGKINCGQTTVAVSGNNITMTWRILPTAAFAGPTPKQLRMRATDISGTNSGWKTKGSWTISQ